MAAIMACKGLVFDEWYKSAVKALAQQLITLYNNLQLQLCSYLHLSNLRYAKKRDATAHLIGIKSVVNQLRNTHGAVVRQRVAEGDNA